MASLIFGYAGLFLHSCPCYPFSLPHLMLAKTYLRFALLDRLSTLVFGRWASSDAAMETEHSMNSTPTPSPRLSPNPWRIANVGRSQVVPIDALCEQYILVGILLNMVTIPASTERSVDCSGTSYFYRGRVFMYRLKCRFRTNRWSLPSRTLQSALAWFRGVRTWCFCLFCEVKCSKTCLTCAYVWQSAFVCTGLPGNSFWIAVEISLC